MTAPPESSETDAPALAAQPKRNKSEKESAIALKTWVVLARAYLAIERHVAADVARHDLTASEFGILEALYHKGPLLLGDLQRGPQRGAPHRADVGVLGPPGGAQGCPSRYPRPRTVVMMSRSVLRRT